MLPAIAYAKSIGFRHGRMSCQDPFAWLFDDLWYDHYNARVGSFQLSQRVINDLPNLVWPYLD